MKIAVTGKGGVGKTTVAASLARCWRDLGYRVVAVDADPDANLAGTLGYRGAPITPLVQLKQLIEERVGGGEGWGGFLRMNPRVDDIPEQFGIEVDGVRVLFGGTGDHRRPPRRPRFGTRGPRGQNRPRPAISSGDVAHCRTSWRLKICRIHRTAPPTPPRWKC
jgi:GTPase SAR1 family protein